MKVNLKCTTHEECRNVGTAPVTFTFASIWKCTLKLAVRDIKLI